MKFFLAMKIHISESTKRLLDIFGNFTTEERGTIEVKVSVILINSVYQYSSNLPFHVSNTIRG